MTVVAGKRQSLLMAGDDEEVYDKKPQYDKKPHRYAEDNRAVFNCTQWFIWSLSDNNKRLRSKYYTVEASLKHKASRGLSATAELLVIVYSRLDRGAQSATEMLPLKRGDVLHIVLTAPPAFIDMRLAHALVIF